MDGISSDVHQYEECLSNFFSSIQWNKDADNCVSQLLASCDEGKTKSISNNEEEENPYSDEPLLPPPYPVKSVVSPKAESRITIDADLQRKILQPFWKSNSEDSRPTPVSLAHEWLLFTKEERVALRQYALQHTQPPPTPPELVLQLESETESGGEGEAARLRKQQRDLRRRRQAYRTAATGSKTLTEVTREVIRNIMELIGVPVDGQKQKDPSPTESSHSTAPVVSSSSGQKRSSNNEDFERKERSKHHESHSSRRHRHRTSSYDADHAHSRKRRDDGGSRCDKRRSETRIGSESRKRTKK